MRKKRREKPDAEAFTREDLSRLLGLALLLAAFLMLTFTPQLAFRAWMGEGYVRTEAEMLSGPGGGRSVRIRIAWTGDELSVRRSSFETVPEGTRMPIWWNPSARVVLGITLFDERALSAKTHPELPTLAVALLVAALNVVLGVAGARLLLRPPIEARSRKTKSRS